MKNAYNKKTRMLQSKSNAFSSSFLILHLSLLLFLVGCKVERPKEVLPPSKMEDVLYDYHLAQVMGGELGGENMYKRGLYVDYVFKKHHVTRAQLDSSLVWYTRHPKELSDIYERLETRTEHEIEYIRQRQAQVSTRTAQPVEGDSADLWYESHHFILTPSPIENYRAVTVPFDANFHKCDTIRWMFDVIFVGQQVHEPTDGTAFPSPVNGEAEGGAKTIEAERSLVQFNQVATDGEQDSTRHQVNEATGQQVNERKAIASLIIRYANDSVIARDVVMMKNMPVSITLQNADSVNVKSVIAGVYFQSDIISDHLVVTNNRLLRYHSLTPKDTAEVATPPKKENVRKRGSVRLDAEK